MEEKSCEQCEYFIGYDFMGACRCRKYPGINSFQPCERYLLKGTREKIEVPVDKEGFGMADYDRDLPGEPHLKTKEDKILELEEELRRLKEELNETSRGERDDSG